MCAGLYGLKACGAGGVLLLKTRADVGYALLVEVAQGFGGFCLIVL
jgi:hypothetical protein